MMDDFTSMYESMEQRLVEALRANLDKNLIARTSPHMSLASLFKQHYGTALSQAIQPSPSVVAHIQAHKKELDKRMLYGGDTD
jgi:hypothetical protein